MLARCRRRLAFRRRVGSFAVVCTTERVARGGRDYFVIATTGAATVSTRKCHLFPFGSAFCICFDVVCRVSRSVIETTLGRLNELLAALDGL